MGEYEPNDSRNVTGTAATQDGRWTAQGQQPPNAEGQMEPAQMDQSGQSVGQSGEGVNSASNQSNDHTSGIGQEQQLDATGMDQGATGQAGQTGWTTANAAGQVREGQCVIDSQGQDVGTVDSVDGDRIKLTRKDSADGRHHYVSASQVESCEGDEVRLNCSADQLQN